MVASRSLDTHGSAVLSPPAALSSLADGSASAIHCVRGKDRDEETKPPHTSTTASVSDLCSQQCGSIQARLASWATVSMNECLPSVRPIYPRPYRGGERKE